MINVLITCAGGAGEQNKFDAIRNNPDNEDVKIIGTDLIKSDILKHQIDKFYQITRAEDSINGKADPMWIDKFLDICKKESVDVILSSNEGECNLISKNIKQFEANGLHACVNSPETYERTDNKYKTFVDLESKIAVPKFWMASDLSDYNSHNIKGTVCFKPARRSSSGNAKGFRIIGKQVGCFDSILRQEPDPYISKTTAKAFFKENNGREPMLLMEYLPDKKYPVQCFSHHGTLMSHSINIMNKQDHEFDLDVSMTQHKKITEYCEIISKEYNLEYCSNISFKEDSKHNPKLLEINPRLGNSSALSWQGGLNYPYICIKKALGENFEQYIVPNKTSRVFRYWKELSLDQNQKPI